MILLLSPAWGRDSCEPSLCSPSLPSRLRGLRPISLPRTEVNKLILTQQCSRERLHAARHGSDQCLMENKYSVTCLGQGQLRLPGESAPKAASSSLGVPQPAPSAIRWDCLGPVCSQGCQLFPRSPSASAMPVGLPGTSEARELSIVVRVGMGARKKD